MPIEQKYEVVTTSVEVARNTGAAADAVVARDDEDEGAAAASGSAFTDDALASELTVVVAENQLPADEQYPSAEEGQVGNSAGAAQGTTELRREDEDADAAAATAEAGVGGDDGAEEARDEQHASGGDDEVDADSIIGSSEDETSAFTKQNQGEVVDDEKAKAAASAAAKGNRGWGGARDAVVDVQGAVARAKDFSSEASGHCPGDAPRAHQPTRRVTAVLVATMPFAGGAWWAGTSLTLP